MKDYYVYIASNKSRTLYIGMTNDLSRRMMQHKQKATPGFTTDYNIDQLVYLETTHYVDDAILREKQLKGWGRKKKIALIETINPGWHDLSRDPSTALRMTT